MPMHAAGAGLVLDDDRRAERFGEPLRHEARDEVRAAAGRERHDDAHRLGRVLLRKGRQANRARTSAASIFMEPPRIIRILIRAVLGDNAPPQGEAPMIKIENLVKTFGAKRAVDGISFTVERGEVLGFLGPERRRQVHHHAHDHRLLCRPTAAGSASAATTWPSRRWRPSA